MIEEKNKFLSMFLTHLCFFIPNYSVILERQTEIKLLNEV